MKTLFFLLFLVSPLMIFSQSNAPGIVTGRITDAVTGTPVEYANVVVVDTVTKKMAGGGVSDSSGRFWVDNLRPGTYYLEYSFIGYEKQKSRAFSLDKRRQKVDFGELKLSASAINMNEVTVSGEKSTMINRIDRKVFNVQKDLMAQSGTVIDMLQTIPSISVDVEGNITLRGSGVNILINGRPSVMAGIANLDQMPAALVERIEIITNPSAKYKPDGTGGIINIILKKEQKQGFNTIIGANLGNKWRFNSNIQANYNTGKFNFYGSYGFRKDHRYRYGDLQSETIDTTDGTSTWLGQESSGEGHPLSHMGRLGMDWYISKKDAAGVSLTGNIRKISRSDDTWKQYRDNDSVVTEEYSRVLDGMESSRSLGINAYYEHTFDRAKEHVFKANAEFEQDNEDGDDNWTNTWNYPLYPQTKDRSFSDNSDMQLDLAVEYSRPLWEDASLETGYELTAPVEEQNEQVDFWDPDQQVWVNQPDQANVFYGTQTVHALYGIVSMELGKFGIMGGLRAEEAIQNLEFRSSDTTAGTDYFALYPTVHLNYVTGNNEWQLNYSRRVNRPDVSQLNPKPFYRDPRNIFAGNPDLKPEDIHSFEAGYSFGYGGLRLVPTLFYRYKVNGITFVTEPLNDTVLYSTIKNLDSDQSAGLDLSGNWQIRKIASVNFSASGFWNQIDASGIGYSDKKSAFSWNAKINASFNLTRTTILQVNSNYRSGGLTPQGEQHPSWVLNLGFRQDFFRKKLSFIATLSDVFDSQQWKTTLDTPELKQENVRHRDAPVFFAGFTVNLGKTNKKEKEPRFEYDNGGGGL